MANVKFNKNVLTYTNRDGEKIEVHIADEESKNIIQQVIESKGNSVDVLQALSDAGYLETPRSHMKKDLKELTSWTFSKTDSVKGSKLVFINGQGEKFVIDDENLKAYEGKGKRSQIIHYGELLLNSPNGEIPDREKRVLLGTSSTATNLTDDQWKNIENDLKIMKETIDKMKIEEQIELGFYTGEGQKNYEAAQYIAGGGNLNDLDEEQYQKITGEARKVEAQTEHLNPYVQYMERLQREQEGMERGLLDAQTQAAREQADIGAQQAMMQQAQFKDQLLEQIKSQRLGKMRQGISPMQIANEELQMMVGGMQQNTQLMAQATQQQLAATQQERMTPYQAYINSQQAVTGGQGYGNLAAGLAATDASSMSMQIQELMNRFGWSDKQASEYLQTNRTVQGKPEK